MRTARELAQRSELHLRFLLETLADELDPGRVSAYELTHAAPEAFAAAYAAWSDRRYRRERLLVLRIAAERVIGTRKEKGGRRRWSAHFQRPADTDAQLREALDELQAIKQTGRDDW